MRYGLLLLLWTWPAGAAVRSFDCASRPASYAGDLKKISTALSTKLPKARQGRCFPSPPASAPLCPATSFAGLDSRFPVGGLFLTYTGDNAAFLREVREVLLKTNPSGVLNILIPKSKAEAFGKDAALLAELNRTDVNLVPVAAGAAYAKWTRDLFRFVTFDGRPALLHLNYGDESELELFDTLTCELARQCGVPLVVPSEITTSKDPLQGLGIDSGGNVGVLPGGRFYRGVIGSKGFNDARDEKVWAMTSKEKGRKLKPSDYPVLSPVQKRSIRTLASGGRAPLDLDIAFLYIGHVDEIVNVVKTKDPAPCDFAVLRASPARGIEILERLAKEKSDFRIRNRTIPAFVHSEDFKAIRNESLGPLVTNALRSNEARILEELRKSTGCAKPKVVEVPWLLQKGRFVLPNLVNGVELSTLDGGVHYLTAKTFFAPFDEALRADLRGLGVESHFVDDQVYFQGDGDVHCGSNEVRLCRKP